MSDIPLPKEVTDELMKELKTVVDLKEGAKFDSGKLRYDLVDAYALECLVAVYTFGIKKHGENEHGETDWRKGIRWRRIFSASMRHLWAFWMGEEIDPESGLPHLAHAAWNVFTLLNYTRYRREFDDRQKEAL